MLEKSLGILFYLKKTKNHSRKLIPIYLRITVDGVPKELSIKRSWVPERWNKIANRAKGSKLDSKILNEYIDILQNKVYDARKQLTGTVSIIPLLPVPCSILAKYKNDAECIAENSLLPVLSNQNIMLI